MFTPSLSLPALAPAQASKHVIVNEAFERLDATVQLSMTGVAYAPDPDVLPGTAYRVGADPSGAFAGHAGELAWLGLGGWLFFTPQNGWIGWDQTEARHLIYRDGVWRALSESDTLSTMEVARLSVNTAPDPNNHLSVRGDVTLLDAENNSHRLVVNRASVTDTASLVFQTGYAGQAEIGLTGNQDLAFRVSADGTNWSDAMRLDAVTGQVSFPNSNFGAVSRQVFTSGSGIYMPPSGVRALQIAAVGAGGGGAGAETLSSNVMTGAGGGGGGATALLTVSGPALQNTFTYTVGAGGTGGSAASGDPVGSRSGGDGGDTRFEGGTVTLVAGGGIGAVERAASAGHNEFTGGRGGTASGGALNVAGGYGGSGLTAMIDYFFWGSGDGGNSSLGQGARMRNGPGRNGDAYGGGGAGAGMVPRFVLNRSGGSGASGCLMITEYY